MARGNGPTELRIVERAELRPTDVVLVVGPGPGVGLRAAGEHARLAVGVDPSALMLAQCRRRCADLVERDAVLLRLGDAADTGQPDGSVDVAISVNSYQLWPDPPAGLAELHRVLRPDGRLLFSVHERWLPGGRDGLTAAVQDAGFVDVVTEFWEPPGRSATTAVQLGARKGAP